MNISIRWKIILFIILPVVAVYSLFTIFSIVKMKQWAVTSMEHRVMGMARDFANRLDSELEKAGQIAELIAAFVEKEPGLSSDMMVSLLKTSLVRNPMIHGAAIAFAPHTYLPEKELFIRYVHKENDKLVVSGFVYEGYDYTSPEHEYWHKPRTSGKAVWSEPYFDEGGGNFLMCTYSVPFFKNGTFAGIALVDIPLEPLRKLALKEMPENARLDVITPSGKFVYSSDHQRINRFATDIETVKNHPDTAALFKAMGSGKPGLIQLTGWEFPEPELVAYATMDATDWRFSVSVTRQQAYKEIQDRFHNNILLFLGSLVVIVPSLWFFTTGISRSILALNHTVVAFSKGNLNATAPEHRKDEIGALGAAFNQMAAELTEREVKLFETQKLFEASIQQIPIPIMVVPVDGKINIFNYPCKEILGITDTVKPGIHLMDMVPTWKDYDARGNRILPKDAALVKALRGIPTRDLEIRIVRADGTERWAIANGEPVYDKNGNLLAGIVVFPDITQRKIIEEDLRESEERFRRIAENAKDMIYRMTLPDGVYDYVSPASVDLFGYTPEEFYARPLLFREIIHKDWLAYFQEQWQNLLNGDMPASYEYQVVHKSGTVKWLNQRNVLVKNREGKPIAIEGIVTDVTEAKLAQEEKARLEADLRQAHKMEAMGTLAGGIAHDFNNILSAIIGYAELAKDDLPRANPAREEIEEVINAGKRARDLVKHILAFSRKSGEDRIPVKPQRLAEDALNLIRASLPSTIEIRQHIDPECGPILADPTQFHQIIMNLCTNGAQAMDDSGGILDFSLTEASRMPDSDAPPAPHARIVVKDTGIGIPQNIIDRIFDPYFTTKEYGKGSGMGLAIVHGIVESHKGKITVKSKVGQGTTVEIYFPVITDAPLLEEKNSNIVQGGTERILLVDDEESMADVTMRRLKRLGYHVTVRTGSTEALALFENDPYQFELVITDQTMPKMTGEQMAIKMMGFRADIPVILCTGYSSKIDREKARAIGIKAFLLKPVDTAELSETIRNILDGDMA